MNYKQIVEQAGAKYVGLQETPLTFKTKSFIQFNDFEGFTCCLTVSEVSVKNVKKKLADKQKEKAKFREMEVEK